MTDPEKRDHWGLLASELGAKIPPEEPKEDSPVVEQAAEEPEPVRPVEPRYSFTSPSRQQSVRDWAQLAESLGVALDQESAEALTQAPEETTSMEVVEPQAPEDFSPEPPAMVMEPDDASVDVTDVLADADADSTDLVDHVDTEAVDESEESEERTGKRRRRKRRRRRRKPEEGREVSEGETPVLGEEAVVEPEEREMEEAEPEATAAGSESLIVSPLEPLPEGAGRGKRRRRRRSGKKKTAEAFTDEAVDQSLMSVANDDALVPLDEDLESGESEAGFGDEDLESGESEAGFDDEDDAGEESDEDGLERASHRGIPTWQEAVGVIIARNMESRAKNPGGQQRPRGRGRG